MLGLPDAWHEPLDRFFWDCHVGNHCWDGVVYLRVVEARADFVRLVGSIYDIDQSVHSFWLAIAVTDHGIGWTLQVGTVGLSPRRTRDAHFNYDYPDEVEHAALDFGSAEVRDGELRI